jgi:hypothetical protein
MHIAVVNQHLAPAPRRHSVSGMPLFLSANDPADHSSPRITAKTPLH